MRKLSLAFSTLFGLVYKVVLALRAPGTNWGREGGKEEEEEEACTKRRRAAQHMHSLTSLLLLLHICQEDRSAGRILLLLPGPHELGIRPGPTRLELKVLRPICIFYCCNFAFCHVTFVEFLKSFEGIYFCRLGIHPVPAPKGSNWNWNNNLGSFMCFYMYISWYADVVLFQGMNISS